jgi:hypothetical protein
MSLLIRSVTSAAYDRYVRELSAAFLRRDWIYDPSYAAAKDIEVYEKIRRDPVFAHVLDYRKRLVAGRDWVIEPASEDEKDMKLAKLMTQLLRELKGFTQARFNLAEAIPRGSAYAYIEGETKPLNLVDFPDGATWWVPTRLVDVDRRRFALMKPQDRTADAPAEWHFWSVDREKWEPLGERSQWFLRSTYDGTEDTLGYGRGLLDSLFFYAAAKTKLMTDGLAAADRFAQGFVTVGIANFRASEEKVVNAGDGGQSLADTWVSAIKKHRAENVLVHDVEDVINVHTGIGEGYGLIESLKSYIDDAVTRLVLGSILPTGGGADVGSNARAEVEEGSTDTLVAFDHEKQGEDIDRDLLGALYRYNYPQIAALGLGGARPGRFRLQQERLGDPTENAATIVTLLGAGIKLKKAEVYRKIGYSQPEEDDEVIESLPEPAPAAEPGAPGDKPANGPKVDA